MEDAATTLVGTYSDAGSGIAAGIRDPPQNRSSALITRVEASRGLGHGCEIADANDSRIEVGITRTWVYHLVHEPILRDHPTP